ncbi:Structure-specific endonuclease subunit SLX1 homolog [Strongyloides ratti]|uniref:Structure-specific endonuclease subunit SLX1 homolog n=1 Tax=Strongyloides ratti TaxID=34506 RepID=A0A090LB94_STRRB|nr:Structure-specific endonuclease subunit SLX1 homolog [Strongyloides ratti]CEF65398.1 Structure-specific endonuclease subunit SLX1 homolog [Strongyloides ratti]
MFFSHLSISQRLGEVSIQKKQRQLQKIMTEDFFGVYCLISQSPLKEYQGKCYIGFTVDPNRRIRQHNRELLGGAKKTKKNGPHDMVCIVEGFPNKILALRFEWAWQNPSLSRRIKHLNLKKNSKESHFNFKIRVCCTLLNTAPWKRLALSFRWLKPEYYIEFSDPQPPRHMHIYNGLVINNKIIIPQDPSLYMPIPNCYICGLHINAAETLVRCISKEVKCKVCYHKVCLANSILDGECNHLIPLKGKCLSCKSNFLWGDLIRDSETLVNMEGLKPSMDDGSKKILEGNFERIQ